MNVFNSYANFYDALYREKDYPAECDYLEEIFREHSNAPVRSILDLGCGTGGHAILLSKRGYSICGVDLSARMLAHAREKAERENLPVEFLQADTRNLSLNRSFDAAIAMFAVVGYHVTNEDLTGMFQSVRNHLAPGGLFIFDVWFGPAVLTEKPADRVRVVEESDERLIRLTRSKLDIMRHVVEVNFNALRVKGDTITEQAEETHLMRFFFPKEIEFLLKESSFSTAGIFPFLSLVADDVTLSTWNICVIARAE